MIALVSANAARSSAVLISGLPPELLSIPSKTLGASRQYAGGCTFVQAASAPNNIIPAINTVPAASRFVIDKLPSGCATATGSSFVVAPTPCTNGTDVETAGFKAVLSNARRRPHDRNPGARRYPGQSVLGTERLH